MHIHAVPQGRRLWDLSQRGTRGTAAVLLSAAVIVLAAAVIRAWGLGAKATWFDEAYSVFMARQPLGELLGLLAAYDNHPPLYYTFLHFWISLAGDGDVSVRLPSTLASVGAVLLTFLLARRLAGDRVALLAAALLAASPFQVSAAREARMYPFLTLFGVGASYALWLALAVGRRRHWVAYVLCLVLAMYTHYLAVLLFVAYGVHVAAVERARAGLWTRWMALALLLALPLLLVLWPQLDTARALPAFQKPLAGRALVDLLGLLTFGGGLFGMGTYYQRGTLPAPIQFGILLPFLAVALAGLARGGGTRERVFVGGHLLLPVIVMAVIATKADVFQERYFTFVLPPFVILVASGIAFLSRTLRGLVRLALLGAVLPLLAGLTIAALVGVYRTTQPLNEWRVREAGRYVTARAEATDFVLYMPSFVGITFERYFRGRQERTELAPRAVLTTARQTVRGTLRLRTSVPPDEMARIARAHPRMWIISSTALGRRVRGQIAEALAPYFRQVDERTFGLVSASLWESRLFGATQRP